MEELKAELERIKKARNASAMKWQAANAEKVKATRAIWVEKNKDRLRERARINSQARRERAKAAKTAEGV
jgi:hypothetical protein